MVNITRKTAIVRCVACLAQVLGMAVVGANDGDLGSMLRIDLETCFVVDGRPELNGVIQVSDRARFRSFVGKLPDDAVLQIHAASLTDDDQSWETSVPLKPYSKSGYPLAIPIARLASGYHRLTVSIDGSSGHGAMAVPAGEYLALGRGGPVVDFAVLEKKQTPHQLRSPEDSRYYLDFVIETAEKLILHQSCRIGGFTNGVAMITVVGKDAPPRRRLVRDEKGRPHRSEAVSVQGVGLASEFFEPYGADLRAWMLFDRLSMLSGDAKYSKMVTKMVEAFVPHGFDPKSGLGYMGEEAQLDVFRLKPVNRRRSVRPLYKHGPELPMERLWKHAPEQMARMSKAMFYGLVTDPDLMSYNRFCDYGFDDRARKPFLKPNERHGAFESAAGGLIQWWASCFAHTGDRECLGWAQKLADKWEGGQDARSGLVPYVIQVKVEGSRLIAAPSRNANTRGGAKFAAALLKSAEDFSKRPEGRALAEQLSRMGLKLARGVARYGYDDNEGRFLESLRLDGTPITNAPAGFFTSREEKDKVVKIDPQARLVPVYNNGESFYFQGPYWRYTTGIQTPRDLAIVAELTKDPELLKRLHAIARQIMAESHRLTSEFTPQGKWTFTGTGLYIKVMMALHRASGDPQFLRWAKTLADEEISRLDQIVHPEWWRMLGRSDFLEALLQLHSGLQKSNR